MKAVRVTGKGLADLSIRPEPMPTVGRRDILVRVEAASLNFRDTLIVRGAYAFPLKERLVPLSDGAGEVVAIGSGVTRFNIGDRVTAQTIGDWSAGPFRDAYRANCLGMTNDGFLATHTVVDEHAAIRIPPFLSYAEAAALPCAAVTAWSALHVGEPLQPGQKILVEGTGGVSLFALQIARMFNARVFAITSSNEKAKKLIDLGAEAVINYNEVSDWGRKIYSAADGEGVDKVVEVGGAANILNAIAACRVGAQIGLVGYLAGADGGVPLLALRKKSINLQAIGIGTRLSFEGLLAAMAATSSKPVIDSSYCFENFKDAFGRISSGNHFGKVLIEMSAR